MPRILGYIWAAPATALGLVVVAASCLSGGSARIVRGTIEVHGGFATRFLRRGIPLIGPGAAMTSVTSFSAAMRIASDVSREHEHVHVRQYERWGPLFLPIYITASLVLWLRGRDPYLNNPFEREAYEQAP